MTATNTGPVPLPTGANPATVSYPGEHNFSVKFHRLSDNVKNKSWDVSTIILFTNAHTYNVNFIYSKWYE